MNWSDERYVRLYTRDTPDWLCLSFLAQGLFCLILRKVDRAGVLPLGRSGRKGVFVAIGHAHQAAMLDPALEELLDDGSVELHGDRLVVPNFLEAQEAEASDKARARKHREKVRDLARAAAVTAPRDTPLDVTDETRPVTERHDTHEPRDASVTGRDVDGTVRVATVTPNRAVPSVPPDPPARPLRAARLGVGHPAFEAVEHWRGRAWPKLSPSPCPTVTERDAASLSRLVVEHSVPVVVAAMDRAAADAFWRDKLTLDVFVDKFARFLPRHGPGGPAPKRKLVVAGENGQPVFVEDAK